MSRFILGTRIDCADARTAVGEIERRLDRDERTAMFTPNLLMVGDSAGRRDENILNRGDLNVADGSGIYLALRRRKARNTERTSGIDVAERALEAAAKRGLRVYLLGGRSGVAQKAADELSSRIEGLIVCGAHHGYFELSRGSEDMARVTENIRSAEADVLVVCLGYPRQERFILDVYHQLDGVKLFMALGGSLDVWSGKTRRAPKAAQELHLEWLWRCILQPARIKRAVPLPLYFFRALLHR